MFHHIRPLIQFTPARAKKKVEIYDLTAKHLQYLTDQKIDGERYVLHTDVPTPQYQHAITSRRLSEVTGRMVEKTDRVPVLTNCPGLPPKSLFDNELVSSGDMVLVDLPGKYWDKLLEPNHPHMKWLKKQYDGALPSYPHVGATVSILGSLGPEAVRKQEERGAIWAYCFDIIQYQGKNLTANTQMQRRKFLASLLEPVPPVEGTGIILMPTWVNLTKDEIEFLFYLVTDDEGEGLILKDPVQKYNGPANWYKIKRDYGVDCVYTGESIMGTHGKTGQMEGLAASLEIGVYQHGQLFPIGWVSGIRDGHHRLQTPAEHLLNRGQVIECRHNGLQKDTSPLGYTLRHPRWRRDRFDKNAIDCTFEALYEESNKKLG